MSDTPRTDAVCYEEYSDGWRGGNDSIVSADFARQLERELAEAEKALNTLGYEKHGIGWAIDIAENKVMP